MIPLGGPAAAIADSLELAIVAAEMPLGRKVRLNRAQRSLFVKPGRRTAAAVAALSGAAIAAAVCLLPGRRDLGDRSALSLAAML